MIDSRPAGTLASACCALICSMAFGSNACAQDLQPKSAPQSSAIIITGAMIHTVSNGVVENGVVAFDEGRITYVGPAASAPQMTGDAQRIDASGLHVYPGLIAPRTQLGHVEVSAVNATLDSDETGTLTPEVRAAAAVNPDSTLLPVTRTTGILLAGVFPSGGLVPGRLAVIRLDGWTWEDMALDPLENTAAGSDVSGLVIDWPTVRLPHFDFPPESVSDREDRMQEQLGTIRRAFESAIAYRDALDADPDRARDLRLEAMLPALPGSDGSEPIMPTYIIASDLDQITSAIDFALEFGIAPVIVGGHDAPLCSEILIEHDIPVIVTGAHRFPKRADSAYDEAATVPLRLHEAGVRFCIDGSERVGNVRNLPFEAAAAARHGLAVEEAVRALTLSTAEILGIDDDYGSIEVGKSATLILTTGNPLEITTDVLGAYIDGRDISLTSKQTELLDKYAEKYRQLGILEE